MHTNKYIWFVSSIVFFLSLASIGKAQGTCVIPTLKVQSVKGRVVWRQYGIPDVTVELRDWNYQNKTLASFLTNEDGNFEFNGVKKGKYLLVIRAESYLGLDVPIRVEPKTKNKVSMLAIFLARDYSMSPCSEGGAERKDFGH